MKHCFVWLFHLHVKTVGVLNRLSKLRKRLMFLTDLYYRTKTLFYFGFTMCPQCQVKLHMPWQRKCGVLLLLGNAQKSDAQLNTIIRPHTHTIVRTSWDDEAKFNFNKKSKAKIDERRALILF